MRSGVNGEVSSEVDGWVVGGNGRGCTGTQVRKGQDEDGASQCGVQCMYSVQSTASVRDG